jgi:hypothetical protein
VRFLWCALAALVGGTALILLAARREYASLVDYCKTLPLERPDDPLSCLDAGNWFSINVEILAAILAESFLVLLVLAGLVRVLVLRLRRRRRATLQSA